MRWAALASPTGRPLQATTRFEELDPTVLAEPVQEPKVGTLEEDDLNTLVDLLTQFTGSPESCWFAVWEGHGQMRGPPAVATVVSHPPDTEAPRELLPSIDPGALPLPVPPGPRVQIPERALALYAGPIEAANAMYRPALVQSPNLWWPADRAWCVASEIDFRSTYIGGPQALIDRILRDDRLEALTARITDRVSD